MNNDATVFVLDDDPSVRRSLARLIGSTGLLVETFASAPEFLKRERPAGPACLVLDLRLGEFSGLEVQKRLADKAAMPIIFITGYGTVPASVRAMKAGAADFLQKPYDDQELLDAVQRAIEQDRQRCQAQAKLQDIQERIGALTPREREVLELVVTGMLNKQIAYQLGISEKTVKVHRARVMEKMKAESLADLVRLTVYTLSRLKTS